MGMPRIGFFDGAKAFADGGNEALQLLKQL